MKRGMLLASAALFAAAAVADTASAFGGRKNRGGVVACETPVADCGTCGVTYVDKEVTCYKNEIKTKDVEVTVMEQFPVQQKYKYVECVPVTAKQKVTTNEIQQKQESFKYTEMVWTPVKEKVKQLKCVPVTKDETYTYNVCKTETVQQKRTVCEWVCVPVTITKQVPVYKTIVAPCPEPAPCADPCATTVPECEPKKCGLFGGGLFKRKKHGAVADCAAPAPAPACTVVCEMQTVTCTVMQRKPVTKEVVCNVVVAKWVPVTATRKVTTYTTVEETVDVTVNKCTPIEKTGTRTVCFYAPVEKLVDVTTLKQVEKEGTRTVYECKPVKKIVKQTYCEAVAYKTTVKVAVPTPCPPPAPVAAPVVCETPCAAPVEECSTGHSRGRLFKRGGGCCGK